MARTGCSVARGPAPPGPAWCERGNALLPSEKRPHRGPDDPAEQAPGLLHRRVVPIPPDLAPGRLPSPPRPASPASTKAVAGARRPRSSDPITHAKKAIADCRDRYTQVRDYTCTFVKRERIDDRLTPQHIMIMKARTSPNSLYFRFQQPNQGREAIYVQGRNNGRIVAHDVGISKFLAGTMHLDPRGSMAMEDNRHPVTEAGIGSADRDGGQALGRRTDPGRVAAHLP